MWREATGCSVPDRPESVDSGYSASATRYACRWALSCASGSSSTGWWLMAGTYNFSIFAGEDFDRVLTWSASAIPVSQGGTPVDLTDYSASVSINGVLGFITDDTSANGQVQLGGVDGTVRMYIPAAIAAQFINSAPLFRLFVTSPSGETSCLLDGTFQVQP